MVHLKISIWFPVEIYLKTLTRELQLWKTFIVFVGFIIWEKSMRLNTVLPGNVFSSFIFKTVVEFHTSEFERLIHSTALKWSLQISTSALPVVPLLLFWAAFEQSLIMGLVVFGLWNLKHQQSTIKCIFSVFPQGLNFSSRSMNLVFSLCRSRL